MLHSRHLHFCRQQGNALLITAIAIVFLVAVAGAGIDLGRQQLVHARLQQSSDAAALAGSLLVGSDTASAAAQRYFALNYSNTADGKYMGVAPSAPPQITPGDGTLQVSAGSSLKNQFVTLGKTSTAVAGSSTVTTDNGNSSQKYDLIFIMDKSDSMSTVDPGQTQTRLQLTTTAAKQVADQLLGSDNPPPPNNSQTGAVAYSFVVDPGDDLNNGALTTDPNAVDTFLAGLKTKCNNVWPCQDQNLIGTDSTAGLQKALNDATSYFRDGAIHVVILLTDGENNTDGEPLQYCIAEFFDPESCNRDCAIQMCTKISDDSSGVVCHNFKTTLLHDSSGSTTWVYTIGYGPQGGSAGTFLSACANGTAGSNLNQYYFIAPDPATLAQVFQTIFTDVKRIHITQ